jgi:salicylate hydroxylase
LLNLLLAAMEDLDIPVQLGKRLVNVHQEHIDGVVGLAAGSTKSGHPRSTKPAGPAVLEFADGSSYEADLVVGCDGLRSRTRAVVKGGDEEPPK